MIMPANLCDKHAWLLVHQAGYTHADPWRALIIMAQVALAQAATCDPRVHTKLGGDLARIGELGCLACEKPDAFGEIVEAAKTHELGAIKALGERWVAEAAR